MDKKIAVLIKFSHIIRQIITVPDDYIPGTILPHGVSDLDTAAAFAKCKISMDEVGPDECFGDVDEDITNPYNPDIDDDNAGIWGNKL